jgi:hypothetical protein
MAKEVRRSTKRAVGLPEGVDKGATKVNSRKDRGLLAIDVRRCNYVEEHRRLEGIITRSDDEISRKVGGVAGGGWRVAGGGWRAQRNAKTNTHV